MKHERVCPDGSANDESILQPANKTCAASLRTRNASAVPAWYRFPEMYSALENRDGCTPASLRRPAELNSWAGCSPLELACEFASSSPSEHEAFQVHQSLPR